MRVVHIIIGLNVGGAELMLKRLVESCLNGSAVEPIVISLTDLGAIGPKLQSRGVTVNSLGLGSVLGIPLVVWRLVRLIRKIRPHVVQTWMYHADLLGGVAARMAGNRHVIWGIRTTDVGVNHSLMTALVRWICARISHSVPQVIVCAAEASRRSHVRAGYSASRMVVVPNGYDFSWLNATPDQRRLLRERYEISQSDVVVGSLGRFHLDKDQENFVRAAAQVALRYPRVRFLMVGRDVSWDNAQLANLINSVGFRERFVLLGERNDVPQCLAAMDIFCLHSRTEGFPNVLAEAMAMGLPCVTTDVGDAAVVLGNSGVSVPKGDSLALANGLQHVLEIPQEQRVALGGQAKERVLREFSMERCRERFEIIYRQVLSEE